MLHKITVALDDGAEKTTTIESLDKRDGFLFVLNGKMASVDPSKVLGIVVHPVESSFTGLRVVALYGDGSASETIHTNIPNRPEALAFAIGSMPSSRADKVVSLTIIQPE